MKTVGWKALLGLQVMIVAVICGSNAQTICNMSFAGLMACKPAASLPNPPPPTAACCTALSHANMDCLCSYKNSKVLPSLGVDPSLAIQLPDKCHLPHRAQC